MTGRTWKYARGKLLESGGLRAWVKYQGAFSSFVGLVKRKSA
jgi:hypothetical protein